MWFTKDDDGFQGWLPVARNGALHTGVAADITVTVVDEDDSASTAPSVSESTQLSGLYTFLIPSSFFTTNGTGQYSVVAVINASGPKVKDVQGHVLRVFAEDFDTISGGGGLTQQDVRDAAKLAPSVGAPAAGSIDEHLDNIDAYTLISKKMLINRLELADGDSGNWILYDDDDVTPLLTFSVTDKGGLLITQPDSAPSRRTRGV